MATDRRINRDQILKLHELICDLDARVMNAHGEYMKSQVLLAGTRCFES